MKLIQWYPGHMHKTQRLIKENLKKVDVIIEILDARIPVSSSNPIIDDLTGDKPRLVVLNKSDLADAKVTELWKKYYLSLGENRLPVAVSSKTRDNLNAIIKGCKTLSVGAKWLERRPIRAMIVGIPNVGKSTVINALAGKKKAAVGNKPGVTKEMQRLNVSDSLQIYDTPGILWPKFEDQDIGFKLALLGSIKDTILVLDEISIRGLEYMVQKYPERIKERYNIEEFPNETIQLIEMIGKKRGCLVSGGGIDYEKAINLFLLDLRGGKLGTFSLELPGEERGFFSI
ncbi:ribosome biogenesis GTPase YlqF [Oceanispirochaeta sp.]|jgi:ribosome biogenesis GTPase A|uniref:ribosome biogenesis GTPase YlqF n=1 Tax=Oceanispirochaeta sp. TaxID=2035350 RepID=UPI002612DAC7|nr:ribosome biogenesis GTPase YlqF [Oceanispirochaeta sp.]MDA3955267.1 ribosome biogenesis GTPase YlqF [Oceanispirochaeta sp.]